MDAHVEGRGLERGDEDQAVMQRHAMLLQEKGAACPDAGLSAANAPSTREACVRMTKGKAERMKRAGFWAADARRALDNYGSRLPVGLKMSRMSAFWLPSRFILEMSV
ncbi:hypothetical protein VB735_01205 [Halotia wernerae UHCC 0503]|nr:hypothetical protein [Halotia wernerae UHCC 0503]